MMMYAKTAMAGIISRMGKYHIFALILPKSNARLSNWVTLWVLLAELMRIAAAIKGQNAINELTGSPGSNWSEVNAPSNQTRVDRANTSPKNFAGHLCSVTDEEIICGLLL